MSKLKGKLEKPAAPKENFHHLETTTPKAKMPTGGAWDLVRACLDHESSDMKICGVYLNAVLTERKLTHLLSGVTIANLLKNQDLIPTKTIKTTRAASFLDLFEKDEVIKVLRPVVPFKKAAVVTITEQDIIDQINREIGAEVSAQYAESVISFYEGSNASSTEGSTGEVLLGSSTTYTDTNIYTSSAVAESNVIEFKVKEEIPAKKAVELDTNPTPNCVSPLPLELAEKCLKLSNLTDYERDFLVSIPEKIAKYGCLKEKQTALLSKIAEKLPKPEINQDIANTIISSHKNPEATAEAFKQYAYEKRKIGIANILQESRIPVMEKKKIRELLGIEAPKKKAENYYY